MRIAEFISSHREDILVEAANFAKTLPTLASAPDDVLRDHFSMFLDEIVKDLRQSQSRTQSVERSHGLAPRLSSDLTAAEEHGVARAKSGLTTSQLVAEYRALRSSVLRLWSDRNVSAEDEVTDVNRFNEAIDQALFESTVRYELEVERWRHIFLGIVGHDLRTPLNAIALSANVIKVRGAEQLQHQAAVITKGVRRIASMLDSLLEYGTSTLGEPMNLKRQSGDLCHEVEEETEIIKAAFPDAIIELNCIGEANGEFDLSRIREAFSNLVSNAIQHGRGRKVHVKVSAQPDGLEIIVTNEGEIPAAKLASIFEPLKRGEGYKTGHRTNLGLGLFICKQIAYSHGGEITAESEDGIVRLRMCIPAESNDSQWVMPSKAKPA